MDYSISWAVTPALGICIFANAVVIIIHPFKFLGLFIEGDYKEKEKGSYGEDSMFLPVVLVRLWIFITADLLRQTDKTLRSGLFLPGFQKNLWPAPGQLQKIQCL
jgi:hypothetical protein